MPQTKSKKFSVFVAILVLLAGVLIGGFLFIKGKTGSASIGYQFNYILGKEQSAPPDNKNIDSDNDGLPDWQEAIYHTNAHSPDSDGDGYLDGEEVASGYDPTKKAPNDLIASGNPQNPRPLPKNMTKALSLKLSQGIISGNIKSIDRTTGQPVTAEELQTDAGLQQAIEDAIGQQIDEFILPDISDSEIKISAKTGKEETKAYFQAIGSASNETYVNAGSEMQVFSGAILNRDFSELERLQKLYQQTYESLKKITVPADFADFHKKLIGIIWVTNNIYKAVRNIDEDPLKTTIALKQYGNITQEAKDLMISLVKQI